MMIKKFLLFHLLITLLTGCMTTDQFSTYLEEKPNNPKGVNVADALLKTGDARAAAGIYERLLVTQPESEVLWNRYADALYKQGHHRKAIVAYEKLGAITEYDCSSSVGMGKSHLKLGRPTIAGSFFSQCLSLDENHENALIGRAIAFDVSGRSDLALSFYAKAISKKPEDIGLRNNYGLSLLMAGKPDAAVAEFGKIAFTEFSTVQVRQNLALAYGMIGDMNAARQVSSLDLSPDIVASNLKIYEHVRRLPGNDGLKSLLFEGKAR